MSAKLLVTGAGGILGRELVRRRPRGVELVARTHRELDVGDREALHRELRAESPDFVIHAAAFTRVDECETEVDRAFRTNALGTRNVAEACAAAGATLVYLSTDYVFDGEHERPYEEWEEPRPLSVYGRSKWWGEELIRCVPARWYVLRTQWLYGSGGHNFVDTMLERAGQGELRVVDDQLGCPTFAGDLAGAIYRVLAADPGAGLYHLSARGQTTWCGLAREVFRVAGLDVRVTPCSTAEFPRPAPRPRYGVLRNYHLELTLGDPMPEWQDGVRRYLDERRRDGS